MLILGVASCVAWAFWGFSYDDAYITYRYSLHLAEGDGLVYNPDERVLGTTAPGYAFVLGILSKLFGTPVAWGTILGLGGLVAAALSPWLLKPPQRPPVGWIVLWGVSLLVARWHVELLGAETLPVLGAACLASALSLGRGRMLSGGLLAGLAASFRFDAVLICGGLGLALWIRGRRFPWKYLMGTLPAGLTVLAVTAYYGSPLPQTLEGKQGEFADRSTASYGAAEWSWLVRDFGRVGAVALLLAALVGLVVLVRSGVWRHPLVATAVGWVVAVEIFYRSIRVPFSPWYHVMTVTLLLAWAAWGCMSVANALARRTPTRSAVTVVLMAPILWTSVTFLVAGFGEPPDPRWRIYRQVGEFLSQETEPGTVAMVEIGVAGYFAPRHTVLDLVGLVSPVAARHGAAEALRRVGPSYVVDPSLFHGRFPILQQLGPPEWRLLRTFEDPASGRGSVRVWESTGGPPSQSTALPARISASSTLTGDSPSTGKCVVSSGQVQIASLAVEATSRAFAEWHRGLDDWCGRSIRRREFVLVEP